MLKGGDLGRGGRGQTERRQRQRKQPIHSLPLSLHRSLPPDQDAGGV
jgi:hypothetical protein